MNDTVDTSHMKTMSERRDGRLRRNLALATQLRVVMDEVSRRLRDRKTDNVEALKLLTGFIEDDTVVTALYLYEKGNVKLFALSDRQFRAEASTSIEKKQPGYTDELDRLLDEVEGKIAPSAHEGRVDGSFQPPKRFCHSKRGKLMAQVTSTNQATCFVYPEANFCTCEHFTQRVLIARSSFTCVHWLSAWLALAMGQTFEIVNRTNLAAMQSSLCVDREEKMEVNEGYEQEDVTTRL